MNAISQKLLEGVRLDQDNLLHHLRDLEVTLHEPSDPDRVGKLLHESFVEFGRSGRIYSKAGTMRRLTLEQPTHPIWSQDYAVAEVADGVALLTYKSGHPGREGEIYQHSLRASLWQRTAHGWQMRFHQGTATDFFVKAENC